MVIPKREVYIRESGALLDEMRCARVRSEFRRREVKGCFVRIPDMLVRGGGRSKSTLLWRGKALLGYLDVHALGAGKCSDMTLW